MIKKIKIFGTRYFRIKQESINPLINMRYYRKESI